MHIIDQALLRTPSNAVQELSVAGNPAARIASRIVTLLQPQRRVVS